MAYQVVVLPRAARAIRKLDRQVARRLARRIDRLAVDPRPRDAKSLSGESAGLLRIRVGDWRILYRVHDDDVLIVVVHLGHRSAVYRHR